MSWCVLTISHVLKNIGAAEDGNPPTFATTLFLPSASEPIFSLFSSTMQVNHVRKRSGHLRQNQSEQFQLNICSSFYVTSQFYILSFQICIR